MNGFQFPLQKALEWRLLQLELEESKFQRQTAALQALDRMRLQLQSAQAQAEGQLRSGIDVQGAELASLGEFRLAVQAQAKVLAQRRVEAQKLLEAQREAMLEARRRCRLLEKLKERRKADWSAALNRELEEVASESFLAKRSRGQA